MPPTRGGTRSLDRASSRLVRRGVIGEDDAARARRQRRRRRPAGDAAAAAGLACRSRAAAAAAAARRRRRGRSPSPPTRRRRRRGGRRGACAPPTSAAASTTPRAAARRRPRRRRRRPPRGAFSGRPLHAGRRRSDGRVKVPGCCAEVATRAGRVGGRQRSWPFGQRASARSSCRPVPPRRGSPRRFAPPGGESRPISA